MTTPPHQVQCRDHEACDRVTSDELRGTVHGPVELGLARDLLPPRARLVGVDQAAIEVGVDGHLLARHRVQNKACGDLTDSTRALCDDHKLDHDEHEEDHQPHAEVVSGDVLTEGLDDVTRLSPGEDQARTRDVQPQPEERREEQDRRERGEFRRLLDVHRRHQDQDRRRQVERQQQIQGDRRQGCDKRQQESQDSEAEQPVGYLLDAVGARAPVVHRASHGCSIQTAAAP
ncbi:hypothetical protein N8607_00475 [bacterium]|nr:hypothetical protein [bacterium]